MRPVLLIALLALAACKPPPPAPSPQAPPSPAPAPASDFSGDIDAAGTEPFWGLKIRGTSFTLTRPDHPDLMVTAPGAVIRPGEASWTATGADGRTLKVTLYVSPCSDGMSDRSYPMSAEVTIGAEALRGCAFPTTAPPKGPA